MDLTPFNFPKRRDVAILIGAGASRGAHFVTPATLKKPPVDADFFTLLRSSGLSGTTDASHLLSFVEREFGSLQVGMETFYSQASLYNRFVNDIPSGGRGRRREYQWNLTYFRRLLPRLFAVSLAGQECRFHEQLAYAAQPGDTFVSFNYDCLLDRAVQKQAKRRWSANTGYGFEIASGFEHWESHEGTGRFPSTPIRILKPHGSLNWSRSENGEWTLLEDEYCDRHADELVLVPPLWQKSFDDEPYQTVWKATRRTLSSVKALFIIGYSLPETDVYTQATLRMDVGPLDFLCVVNPDHEVRARIARTLRSSITTTTHYVEFDRLSELAGALPSLPTPSLADAA